MNALFRFGDMRTMNGIHYWHKYPHWKRKPRPTNQMRRSYLWVTTFFRIIAPIQREKWIEYFRRYKNDPEKEKKNHKEYYEKSAMMFSCMSMIPAFAVGEVAQHMRQNFYKNKK
ncbi:MAG: hypothetical protein GY714_14170 [Desulfobacterales bacterium]|nr:hypothetical protein [Desulfobacterales bacterium]